MLRDGGANGADYVANQTGAASYSQLLLRFQGQLEAPMAFDPAAGLSSSTSISQYSTGAVSWLESLRQQSSVAAENKAALLTRTDAALSNMTGVNIDEELSLLLELEHTYEASARLLATIDSMLKTLIDTVR